MTAQIQLDGHTVTAVCPDEFNPAAQDLLRKLAELHARGPKLKPGSIVDFGWAPLRIDMANEGWVVCEPDFAQDTSRFVPSVAVTLRVLADQARVMDLAHATPLATRFDQAVVVDERAWEAPVVFLNRIPTNDPSESGWYVVPDEEGGPADLRAAAKRITAGKLAIRYPPWMKVLALPPGFLATFQGGRLIEIHDGQNRKVASFEEGDKA